MMEFSTIGSDLEKHYFGGLTDRLLWLARLCALMGARVMADWSAVLTDWLKPFVENLSHKKRRQTCLYMWRG